MWKTYFKVVGIVPGEVIVQGYGKIDFASDSVPVETCLDLFEKDFIYLDITEKGKVKFYGKRKKSTDSKEPDTK